MFNGTMLASPEISSPANASVWTPGLSSPLGSLDSEEDSLSRQRTALIIILAESGYSPVKKSLTVPIPSCCETCFWVWQRCDSSFHTLPLRGNQPEQTGRKLTPDEVAAKMLNAQSPDGNRVFTLADFPCPQQIASFFLHLVLKHWNTNLLGRLMTMTWII